MGNKVEAPAKSSSQAATTKPLRKAGKLEHYFSIASRLDVQPRVVVSAKYHNSSGAALDKATLFAALDRVVRDEPALASRLEYASKRPTAVPEWVLLPSVNLDTLVEFRNEDATQLQNILEVMYAGPQRYADDAPPWKLFVLRDGTVAFAYEHTMGDGQSGMAFHVSLLDALRRLPESLSAHPGVVANPADDTTLCPALEDAMDDSVPFTVILRELGKLVWPPAWRKAATAWTGKSRPKEIVFGTSMRIAHYSPEDGQYLVALSRAHNATLTGTLHTVALLVLSRLIRARPDGQKYKMISTFIPISLRRYTHAPPTAICNHVSSLSMYHPILPRGLKGPDVGAAETTAESFPWELAADLAATLKREAPYAVREVGMLKLLGGKYEKHIHGLLGKKRDAGFELSNLGPFPKSGKGSTPGSKWDIDEVLFAQAGAMGAAFLLNVAGTPAGGFGVSVAYSKETVDERLAEEFVTAFHAGVRGLLLTRSSP
ncbi:hypothetical protein TRAPUB_13747 [Trametes pubescens]|uniref:Alcohol acetyltransferase FCK4 n=1 Tax=Trametes pubescens TaxID=154538 RepID=A0A1M2VQF2_TRAPU|nr:hypothetical protein TRAPUB_13747 [Trametes pubescens]